METSNAREMRKALELMNDLFDKGVICTSYANTPEEMEQIEELYRKAKAALAAPPRQCDVGTADEQNYRHGLWCSKHDVNGDMEADCANNACSQCILKWCQMPYEKGGER